MAGYAEASLYAAALGLVPYAPRRIAMASTENLTPSGTAAMSKVCIVGVSGSSAST